MHWINRRYQDQTWAVTRTIFERLFRAAKWPDAMLMVEEHHDTPSDSTIWIRLPDKSLVSAFEGFTEADPAKLPKRATLLVGKNAVFEGVFTYYDQRPRGANWRPSFFRARITPLRRNDSARRFGSSDPV